MQSITQWNAVVNENDSMGIITCFFGFLKEGLDDPHVSFSQSVALAIMRAGGDVVNAHLFHHLLKVLPAVAWTIVCDNRLGYTIFTEYCFHVFSDMSCCHGLEHADNWKVAHIVYDEQIILVIKCEYVRGQFCPRCCWDFMTK